MKLFLTNVCALLGVVIVILTGIAVVKFVHNQRRVDKHFAVPAGTEVIIIGNSHAGCTFTEAPEFRNRVIWNSSMGFIFHYLRFLELERRGVLDRGIKAVIFDCDSTAIHDCNRENIKRNIERTCAFAWRYVNEIPMPKLEMAVEFVKSFSVKFITQEGVPLETPNWTTLAPKRKRARMLRSWEDRSWYVPEMWESGRNPFPKDFMARFDEMVLDMKARCAKRGIRLIFFASPLATDTPSRANPLIWKQGEELKNRVRALGCEYYDFRSAYPDDRFRDDHHILRSTSYDFTKRFYTEILKLPVGE